MLIVAEDLESATDITEAFSYTIPNIAGATLVLFNWASNGKAYSISLNTGLAVDATRVTTISPAAAELNFPLDNATEVTNTTPFSWTPVPGAVYLLRVTGRGYDQSVPWFYILTSATSATIPDLSQVILTSEASAAYQWEVSGVGPYADVEAAIAGLARTYEINAVLGLNLSSLADNPFLLNSNTYGFATGSGLRDFTTAGAWDY